MVSGVSAGSVSMNFNESLESFMAEATYSIDKQDNSLVVVYHL